MRVSFLAAALLAVLLAGCTSAEPAYYTLAAVPGVARTGGPALVELRRPGIAGYLDRPEIVRGGGYQLRVLAGERWGESFGDLFGRVLAEDLNRRLPGTTVFTSAGSISAPADATVAVDVQRFDADGSGVVVLAAQVAVSRVRRGPAMTRAVRLERPAGGTTVELVAAMSALVGEMAEVVAGMLRGG